MTQQEDEKELKESVQKLIVIVAPVFLFVILMLAAIYILTH